MYLSHPVRRMRADPIEDETVTLRITATDETVEDTLLARLEEIGSVDRRLRFGGVQVTVPQPCVADICSLEGIEAVETANTFTLDADGAGESEGDGEWCRRR